MNESCFPNRCIALLSAPKHMSKIAQGWLFSQGIQCMEWAPYSPDLNPIENLWAYIKRRVEDRNPRNIDELEEFLCDEWVRLPTEYLQLLVHSMTRRCAAVVDGDGRKTKY